MIASQILEETAATFLDVPTVANRLRFLATLATYEYAESYDFQLSPIAVDALRVAGVVTVQEFDGLRPILSRSLAEAGHSL
jgi:hypothetical protein